jgi:putative tryptophan/tyrosine transport system substrate-binding protein
MNRYHWGMAAVRGGATVRQGRRGDGRGRRDRGVLPCPLLPLRTHTRDCEGFEMRRREFVGLVGGGAAWPLAARAQQAGRMRRIGVLMSTAADAPEAPARISTFAQGLQEHGWTVGGNLRIDYRWGGGDTDVFRKFAQELLALAPDVVVATAGSIVGAFQQASRSVPIVFVTTIDPVGSGFVASLARPGSNATGFISYEFSMSGKWLELLKQIAPGVRRVAVIRDPSVPGGSGGFAAIQTVAPSFGVELTAIGVQDADEIDRGITVFARGPNDGLILVGPPSSVSAQSADRIIALTARHRLPAVYPTGAYVARGGLVAYAAEPNDQYRRAAGYVDRILRGEKPADLPVQAPVKYETVLNMKTAKAMGLQVPDFVLVRADEVIE